jgi:hypothetical protein
VRGGTTDYVAISAGLFPVLGVAQPTVLLFETAKLVARRQPGANVLVAALGDGVDPLPITYQERAPGFGRALAGTWTSPAMASSIWWCRRRAPR